MDGHTHQCINAETRARTALNLIGRSHWILYGYVPIAGSVLTYLTRLQDPTIVEWVPDYLPIVYLGSWPSYRIKLGGPGSWRYYTGFTYKEDGVKARRV